MHSFSITKTFIPSRQMLKKEKKKFRLMKRNYFKPQNVKLDSWSLSRAVEGGNRDSGRHYELFHHSSGQAAPLRRTRQAPSLSVISEHPSGQVCPLYSMTISGVRLCLPQTTSHLSRIQFPCGRQCYAVLVQCTNINGYSLTRIEIKNSNTPLCSWIYKTHFESSCFEILDASSGTVDVSNFEVTFKLRNS